MSEETFDRLSPDTEYILSGTIDEIMDVLESDFGLDNDEARFVTYILTLEKKDKLVFEENELKLWYLKESTPSMTAIGRLPYTISLTKLKLEMSHSAFILFGTLALSKDVVSVPLVLDFIWALKESIRKIERREYCVYSRIVDFLYATKKDTFELDDIIPYDKDNECNRKPDKWDCPHWKRDTCSLTKECIERMLNCLDKREIISKVGRYWKMNK